MAILEGLGPKGKLFEDLPVGDYLFEIAEPGEKGWLVEFKDEDDPKATTSNVGWSFRVIRPDEFENRRHSHLTMYDASPQKLAKAKRPYDPSGFFWQFLASIGVAIKDGNGAVLLDDYTTDGDPDLDKMIGVRFNGSLREEQYKDKRTGETKTVVRLTKSWPE